MGIPLFTAEEIAANNNINVITEHGLPYTTQDTVQKPHTQEFPVQPDTQEPIPMITVEEQQLRQIVRARELDLIQKLCSVHHHLLVDHKHKPVSRFASGMCSNLKLADR